MELFLLYLWTRLDGINGALIAITIFGIIPVLALNAMHYLSDESEKQEVPFQAATQLRGKVTAVVGIAFFLAILLPSKEDAAIIAGGWLAKEIITAPETKEVGSKLYQLINKKLDEQLVKQAAEK